MKVVLSRCYGGFGLSQKAIKRCLDYDYDDDDNDYQIVICSYHLKKIFEIDSFVNC